MLRCQKCGYTNQSNAKKCIKCLTVLQDPGGSNIPNRDTSVDIKLNLSEEVPSFDAKKTIQRRTPFSKSSQLIALSEDNKESKSITVKGESMTLNREILDADNTSISRNTHAKLTFKEGGWWIENVTDLKTTYIQANKPMRLSDGDIVLLGDAMFRFKEGL